MKRKLSHRTSPEVEQKAVSLYLGGLPMNEVAKIIGRCCSTVENILKRNGVARRLMSDAKRAYPVDGSFFEFIDTPEKAYLLGFIAADGYVGEEDNTVRINLSKTDCGHLEKIKAVLGYGGPIGEYTVKKEDGRRYRVAYLSIRSRRMAASLQKLGMAALKEGRPSAWFGPPILERDYFRGLVDGDGWVLRLQYKTKKKPGVYWRIGLCGPRGVVQGFADYVFRISGDCKQPHPSELSDNCWVVNYDNAHTAKRVAHALYEGASLYLDRKKRVADRLASFIPTFRSWRFVTADEWLEHLHTHGNWGAVAKKLGIFKSNLNKILRRAGVITESKR